MVEDRARALLLTRAEVEGSRQASRSRNLSNEPAIHLEFRSLNIEERVLVSQEIRNRGTEVTWSLARNNQRVLLLLQILSEVYHLH